MSAGFRVIFMGTPDFATPALQALHEAGHRIIGVFSQPPRRAGRGKQPRPGAVMKAAEALGLPVFTPPSLGAAEAQAQFTALDADVAVTAAYGLLLPPPLLEAPRHGCFNIHASLLPRWRGAAPIQRAIMAGDAQTGVSIIRMDEGLDTGDIAMAEATPIEAHDTLPDLHDRLAAMGARLMLQTLTQLAQDRLALTPQPDQGVSYAARIDKAEARIDWRRDAAAITAQVRALSPFPGAWFEHAGERIKVHEARRLSAPPATGKAAQPGAVLDTGLSIRCGKDCVRLMRLQRAGRRTLDAESFQRGRPISAGEVLA